MPLKSNEKLLAEAIKGMLDDDALGDSTHKNRRKEERSNTFTFLHEEIEQAYRLEVINLEHHDSVCSAFAKIHSHKYLDDPSFALAFKKEMSARAIPMEEQDTALKAMGRIVEKLLAEMNEKDAGWNPDLDEIIALSQPEQIAEGKNSSIIINNYYREKQLFRDPKFRKWVKDKDIFWESVNKKIKPHLEEMGYEINNPEDFWDIYDTEAAEFALRPRMHELFENLQANFQTHGK